MGALNLAKGARILILALAAVLLVAAATGVVVRAQSPDNGRYDRDGDGLIEVSSLEQLNAIRADRDGDGVPDTDDLDGDGESDGLPGFGPAAVALHEAAFPTPGGQSVCLERCYGYELARSLDFREAGSYAAGAVNPAWTFEGAGWTPIPAYNAAFFGNGHTISNLYVDTPASAGLFGYILPKASVSGVGLLEARVAGGSDESSHAGALAGLNMGGEISHSYSTGRVSGYSQVGGLVGFNHGGSIRHSHSSARVSGYAEVGGLAGRNYSRVADYLYGGQVRSPGLIEYSHAAGEVDGVNYVGGLVGRNLGGDSHGLSGGHLAQVYATGNVTGHGWHAGGLVGYGGRVEAGYATGDVSGVSFVGGLMGSGGPEGSYATGDVSGEENVGGLVGESGTTRDSYATGGVAGKVNVGGLVGTLSGRVSHSYSTGPVTGDTAVGGLIGHMESSRYARASHSYWDTATSGLTVSAGGEGRTTAELRSPTGATGIYSAWEDSTWDFGSSGQYPVLRADMDGDGAGSWQEFGPQGRPESYQPPFGGRAPEPVVRPPQRPVPNGRYDTDGDGLIEIEYLEQLDAIRYDPDGDGEPGLPVRGGDADRDERAAYAAAFPTLPGQSVCERDCYGFELARSLDFDDAGSYRSGRVNAGWSLGVEDWEPFDIRGTFNGNGRTLDLGSRTRLFYIIGGAGVVTGVGLLNVSADRGTFAYANFGEISRSYSTGSVTQDFAFAGGIVGNNYGVIREGHTTASVRVSGKGSRVVGGLAGQNLYGGLVTHSCAHGDVWLDPAGYEGGSWPTGGLVGNNDGYVVYGCATGDVRGYTQVGGLVGLGDASYSYATGDVTGTDTVGGLLGAGYASHSYATGSVNGNGYNTGGLAGAFSGVQGSYATGDVTGAIAGIGSSGAGGLVGNTFGNKIVAAYSTGNVLNATRVGGLAGSSGGQVLGSYSISRVFRGGHVGGLLGSIGEDAVASASYWNRDIYDTGIGLGRSEGVIGLTTAEMQSPTGYTGVYADWNTDLDNADLDNDPATGRDDYWDFGSESRYPALKADMDGDGVATAAEFGVQHPGEDRRPPATPAPTEPAPNGRYDADGDRLIEISNLEQLDAMRHDGHALNPEAIDGDGVPWGDEAGAAYSRAFPTGEGERVCIEGCRGYELARSLDFRDAGSHASGAVNPEWTSGEGWRPLGNVFAAAFEGNGFSIYNLYINRPEEDYVGLFRTVSSGTLRSVGLVDVDVKGGYGVGGLVGNLSGYKPGISHSRVSGSVSGGHNTGGLAGFVSAAAVNISDTRFTGSVSSSGDRGEDSVGGLVGKYGVGHRGTPGSIRRSHTNGSVTGAGSWCAVGGLVGENDGNIIASSSAADVVCLDAERAGSAGGLLGTHSDGVARSSFATGNVRAARSAGGLVGFFAAGQGGAIAGSYATGEVTALPGSDRTEQFGGLVGQQYGSVRSTYATGSVAGDTSVGGLAGFNAGSVFDSYSTGRVSGDEGGLAGGLLGRAYGSGEVLSGNYWDTETSGQEFGTGRRPHEAAHDSGVMGRTTAELQAPTGYTGIYRYWNSQGDDLWDFGTGSQYPALKADTNGDGVATWQEFGSQRGNEPSSRWLAREQPCDRTITGDGEYIGVWTDDCVSADPERKGSHARFYTFTLERGREVSIWLESDADTVLYLRLGEGRDGLILYRNDDAYVGRTDSRIIRNMPWGTYTIEAASYHAGDVDAFKLTVAGVGVATPTVPADCLETVEEGGTVSGEWTSGCESANRPGSYARYYTFTLGAESEVDITLESGDADTFLNLLSGAGTDGEVLHYNGDGSTSRSRIQETLAAGSYTVEATTYDPGETGSFTLTITVAGDTTAPPPGDCDTDLGALTATVDLAGSWVSDCPSTNRPGSHAHYYGFTLGQQTDVTIDLTSTRDTIMYLLQGSGRDGDRITFNDDVERGNTNSRIIRTLAAGAYTVEATTYTGGQTGDFTLSIAVAEDPGTPPDTGDCLEDLGSPIFGAIGLPGRSWDSECVSSEREGSYAKYFRFTLEREAEVTITLESQDADPYLYLREGEAQSGPYIWENDDHEGSASVSQIQEEIDAGTYTIEATTYDAGQDGEFTLTITGPPGGQRAALLALYDATGGDNWINNTNWGSNELVREWHGVATDEQGLVIGLSLGGNGLSGEIPANLDWGAFTRLEWLDLGDNRLTGEMPSELDNLPVLKQLYLNDNQLTGEIPPDLGNQHLTRLALQNNQLTGSIPRQMHRLVSLRILNLGNNQLSGPIPTAFAHHLPRLRLLNLEHNLLSGPIPSVLRHLTDLEVLLLGHNRLNGSIPPALGDLSNLELLRLDNQSPFRGGNSGSSDFRQWLWGPIPL